MVKENFIKEVMVGERASLKCFVEKELKTSKTNEPYWSVLLSDSTGVIISMIWVNSNMFKVFEDVEEGDFVKVEGIITEYNGAKQMDINNIEKLEQPDSEIVDIEGIKGEIRWYIQNVNDPGLQDLLFRIFRDVELSQLYFQIPLSSNPNSAGSWRGGSAAFVSRLCRLIDQTADSFDTWEHAKDDHLSRLNKDFLKTLAILEPIGRVRAYKLKGNRVSYTKEGELFGIQYLTMEKIIEELPYVDLPEEKKQLLKHGIASVPGNQSKHSLITDRTREAVAFNSLWNLTYQMMNFEEMDRKNHGGNEFFKIREKTYALERFESYQPQVDEQVVPQDNMNQVPNGNGKQYNNSHYNQEPNPHDPNFSQNQEVHYENGGERWN